MMNKKVIQSCSEALSDSKKTLKDKGAGKSKYLINNLNKKEFTIIDVEKCIYKNKEEASKCDYAILVDDSSIFIELKGRDVKKGIKQLSSTIQDINKYIDKKELKARLVVSEFPKPKLVKQHKEYKDLVKLTKNNLKIEQNQFIESI